MKLITRIRAIRLTERQVLCIYLGMIALLAGLWAIVGSPVVLHTTITARACPSATWVKPSHLRGECRTGGTRRSYSHPQTNRAGPPELLERVEVLSEHVALLEGILGVLLEEAENGTLQQAAAQIRASLPEVEG